MSNNDELKDEELDKATGGSITSEKMNDVAMGRLYKYINEEAYAHVIVFSKGNILYKKGIKQIDGKVHNISKTTLQSTYSEFIQICDVKQSLGSNLWVEKPMN